MHVQHPRVFVTAPAARPTEVRYVVKVVDTAANEWTFLEEHRAQLRELCVVEPRAMVRDFVPGVSALVLPQLTTLREVDPAVAEVALPQLVSVSAVRLGCSSSRRTERFCSILLLVFPSESESMFIEA